MVESECELILSVSTDGHGLISDAVRSICSWDEPKHIDCDRVLQGAGMVAFPLTSVGKILPQLAPATGICPPSAAIARVQPGLPFERVSCELIGDDAAEAASS